MITLINSVKEAIIQKLRKLRDINNRKSEIDRKMYEDVKTRMSLFKEKHPGIWGFLRMLIAVSMVLFSAYMLFLNNEGFFDGRIEAWGINFSFFNGPLILLSAIGGYIPALISFTFLYVFQLFQNTRMAYSSFIFLFDIVMGYQLAKRDVFRSFKKTLVSIPFLALAIGDIWFLVNDAMNANGLIHFRHERLLGGLLGSLPECAIAAILAYCWYTFVPRGGRRIFRFGDYNLSRNLKMIHESRRNGRTWISTRISALLLVEAIILTVCAAIFSNMLMVEMGETIFEEADENEFIFSNPWLNNDLEPPEGSGQEEASIPQEGSGQEEAPIPPEGSGQESSSGPGQNPGSDVLPPGYNRMILNDHGLAYILRLIMMLLNLGIPMVSLADFYAQYTIARPLTRMAYGINAFINASDEDKPKEAENFHKLAITSRDEIRDLYQNMDAMAEDVIDYREHLQKEQKMQEDLRVAERASQAKSDFLSSMSHEIRTPINAVLGLDEMILRESDDDTIVQYALDIQNAGHSLLSLVNDILDFSKIEAGKMEIIPTEYELASTINDLMNMIIVRAEAKGLSLMVNVNPDIPHLLYGDEIRVKQIVTNILTNAVKYTETGSVTMYVDYEKADDENIGLSFRVVDTGIGMKEEDLKKLYSPFERIEEKRNRSIEGTGLGMSIVKQLLDKMDSELVVKSVYGEGSDFSFSVKQKVMKWDPIGDFSKTYKENLKSRKRYRESFRASDADILITDDTAMNLTVVCALLKNTKIRIDTAASGKETLELVSKKKYDAIFLDHMMPEMDGIETLHHMQEMEENLNKDTPVIVLTANAIAGAREAYIEEGFSDYLSKPVDGQKMEDMLIRYLPPEKVQKIDLKNEDVSAQEDKAGFDGISITGIDIEEGEKNCGSVDVLRKVMSEYSESASEKAEKIESFAASEDIKNYTILVHALKSSSRMIGAIGLSEKARYLEECGNAENLDEIREKTPELVREYRDLKQEIDKALNIGAESQPDKPMISEEELLEAFRTIRELVEAFDFDSADDVLGMLSEYSIPEEHRDKYDKVCEAIRNVDQGKLLDIIPE